MKKKLIKIRKIREIFFPGNFMLSQRSFSSLEELNLVFGIQFSAVKSQPFRVVCFLTHVKSCKFFSGWKNVKFPGGNSWNAWNIQNDFHCLRQRRADVKWRGKAYSNGKSSTLFQLFIPSSLFCDVFAPAFHFLFILSIKFHLDWDTMTIIDSRLDAINNVLLTLNCS